MSQQLEYFREYKARLQLAKGESTANETIAEAVYIFSIGTNDFIVNYFTVPLRRDQYTPPEYVAYLVGLVYLSVVWHLASVVSVLEDYKGFAAMRKSKDLIKGKLVTAGVIFFTLNLVFAVVELGFRAWVVKGSGVGSRLLLGLLMLVALCCVVMFALVTQTVVYLVCKSYHHESLDKANISDHLEVYLGDYVPLKASDVQMEQFQV